MKVSELIEMLSKYPADMNVVGINDYCSDQYGTEYIGELTLSVTPIFNNPRTNKIQPLLDERGYCRLPMHKYVGESGFITQPTPYRVLMVEYRELESAPHLEYEKRDELSPDELNAIIEGIRERERIALYGKP